jgi:Mitochondrial carrier protein
MQEALYVVCVLDLGNSSKTDQSPVVYFTCGVLAGCLASLVTHPADVVKTRLQLNKVQRGDMRRAIQFVMHVGFAGSLFHFYAELKLMNVLFTKLFYSPLIQNV